MKKIKIFIAYSKDDKEIKDELLVHFEALKISGDVDTWDDSQIMVGDDWNKAIHENLKRADIVIFLVSSRSIASKYVQENELKKAIERAQRGEVYLVPIIVRHCSWQHSEISKYQVLPENKVPITDDEYWADKNKAYLHITEKLFDLIKNIGAARLNYGKI